MSFLRNPLFSLACTLSAIGASTYHQHAWHAYNLEEHEARMDELEGTLRGHIGSVSLSFSRPAWILGDADFVCDSYIEEALDRLEGKATEADRGKKMCVRS